MLRAVSRGCVRRVLPALIGGVLLAVAGAAAAGEVAPADPYPLRGTHTTLTVTGDDGAPVPGAVVEAIYRPSSETEARETLAPTGADGTVDWEPRVAGIVTLVARSGPGETAPEIARRSVAVRFGGFPGPGILIMALAGLLLFGGAALGFVALMRSPEPETADELPST